MNTETQTAKPLDCTQVLTCVATKDEPHVQDWPVSNNQMGLRRVWVETGRGKNKDKYRLVTQVGTPTCSDPTLPAVWKNPVSQEWHDIVIVYVNSQGEVLAESYDITKLPTAIAEIEAFKARWEPHLNEDQRKALNFVNFKTLMVNGQPAPITLLM